ncbi:MAG: type II toxin-antitoxin system death-on-curing family toxin [Dechloromonas sp.]|mgnify:FL=1|nr:MAG: type II toxin-antitoxin system death-on-curing family toxin [Dechloromonas sp.]
MSFIWIEESVVWAIHEAQLAEHGGSVGVRDAGLLASAMGRPINLAAYGTPDVAACAAAYGYGIARNHPFIDGNKRTAFVCTELFLALNGYALVASDVDCVMIMLAVAAGEMDETEFAAWLRANIAARG